MATRLKKTDVVAIGLGAAGGIAVLPLAGAGLDVVGLEAGPWYSFKDFPSDEIRNDIRNWMGRPKANHEVPTWRPNASAPNQKSLFEIIMINGVGGTSIHYTMQSWRLNPWNFQERTKTIERYGASAIPAGSTLADWPITYDDLEPYYDKAEYEIGVSGQAGNVQGKIDPRGDVFEGARARPYPLPPLRDAGWTDLMEDSARSLGWKPFMGPAAIHSKPYRGSPGCMYCGFCSWNGCHTNAKGSTFLNAIPHAQDTGHLKVVPNSRVLRIEVDGEGRASGVTYLKGGTEFFQPADVVVLSTYTYENTRLLLLSTSSAYPNGLANNHGQVGKHFMAHSYPGVSGLFPGRRLNRYSGPGAQATCLDDWNADNFDHSGLSFIGGALVAASMEQKPIGAAQSTPPTVPGWGSDWKAWLKTNANSVGGAGGQLECLSYEDNYLDLDPTVKDRLGIPVVRVTFDLHENERRAGSFIVEKSKQWLEEAGASETWGGFVFPVPINSHAYGGTRMGTDPESSVVDGWSFSHEVPNLAILGGSTFPTTGGHNPTETIEALAWRSGEYLAENWSSIAG